MYSINMQYTAVNGCMIRVPFYISAAKMHDKKDQIPIKTKYQCSNHRPDRNTSLATPICSTKKRHKMA